MQERNARRAEEQRAAAMAAAEAEDAPPQRVPGVEVGPNTAEAMAFFESEKQRIRDQVGWALNTVRVTLNAVLVAVYKRPDKFPWESIQRPDRVLDEDIYQGHVGLVLKMGARCFEETPQLTWTDADKFEVNDWVIFRRGDANGFRLSINGVNCLHFVNERAIKMPVSRPDVVF
jgi:hypothetical protein